MKQKLLHYLRITRLLVVAEWLNFVRVFLRTRKDNQIYCAQNPQFTPPPLYAMYDAYTGVSYRDYMTTGIPYARLIQSLAAQYHPEPITSLLEWGCGLARVLQHIPALFSNDCKVYGSDYNPTSITWCQKNRPNITFVQNYLSPPIALPDASFDIIYSISVLTHLSAEQQILWVQELRRLLKPKGCLIMTTHSERSSSVLLPQELDQFTKEGIVVRGFIAEGKRCFVTYNSTTHVKDTLFKGMKLCEHVVDSPILKNAPFNQDVWVFQET